MQYIRFMGSEELLAYLWGETLENQTEWAKIKAGSESVGFCFFPYGDGYDKEEQILRYLSGIADTSAVAVFEPIAPIQMKKTFGAYRDPQMPVLKNGQIKIIPKEEYSITQYSNKTFRLVKYGMPFLTRSGWKIEWMCQ